MAGYNDTRELILKALMERPIGTEIQPEDQQAYELNMLDYIRGLELISTNTLIGLAEATTTPVQPNNSKVCYIAGVAQNQNVIFSNFIDSDGNPISITTGDMQGVFVILLWDTEHWAAYTFDTNIISSAENATFYYNYNIKKTYASVDAMNADVTNPIGTDGKSIKLGDLVTVVNSGNTSENGFYSYEGTDWKLQSSFNFQLVQTTGTDINSAMSQNAVTLALNNALDQVGINQIKGWILTESYTATSIIRDSEGNISEASIVYPDNIAGNLIITRNSDGGAISIVATYEADTYTITISRNSDDDVISTTIVKS